MQNASQSFPSLEPVFAFKLLSEAQRGEFAMLRRINNMRAGGGNMTTLIREHRDKLDDESQHTHAMRMVEKKKS